MVYFLGPEREMSISMCVCAQSLNHVRLFATPWTVACQAPVSGTHTHAHKESRYTLNIKKGKKNRESCREEKSRLSPESQILYELIFFLNL